MKIINRIILFSFLGGLISSVDPLFAMKRKRYSGGNEEGFKYQCIARLSDGSTLYSHSLLCAVENNDVEKTLEIIDFVAKDMSLLTQQIMATNLQGIPPLRLAYQNNTQLYNAIIDLLKRHGKGMLFEKRDTSQ